MDLTKGKRSYKWQYNGTAPMKDIVWWCKENFGPLKTINDWRGAWAVEWETIYFQNEKDYILFLLRWS